MKIKCTICKKSDDFILELNDMDSCIWVKCKNCHSIMIKVPYDAEFVVMPKNEAEVQ